MPPRGYTPVPEKSWGVSPSFIVHLGEPSTWRQPVHRGHSQTSRPLLLTPPSPQAAPQAPPQKATWGKRENSASSLVVGFPQRQTPGLPDFSPGEVTGYLRAVLQPERVSVLSVGTTAWLFHPKESTRGVQKPGSSPTSANY